MSIECAKLILHLLCDLLVQSNILLKVTYLEIELGWPTSYDLCLVPIFVTNFLQVRFNQAQLPYGSNSCILLYFILLKHGSGPCNIWEKLRKCGLEGMSWFLLNLLYKPSPCMLQVGKGHWQHLWLMEEVLYLKFSTQRALKLWLSVTQSFYPKPFLPLKRSSLIG